MMFTSLMMKGKVQILPLFHRADLWVFDVSRRESTFGPQFIPCTVPLRPIDGKWVHKLTLHYVHIYLCKECIYTYTNRYTAPRGRPAMTMAGHGPQMSTDRARGPLLRHFPPHRGPMYRKAVLTTKSFPILMSFLLGDPGR